MALADQFNTWADKLVDLTGRNDLISFRQTASTSLALTASAAQALLSGNAYPVRDLVDLNDPKSKQLLRNIIAIAEENSDQLGIDTLRFIDGFVEWNAEKVVRPRSPFRLFPLEVNGNSTALERCEFRIDPDAASINPVLLQYLRSQAGMEVSDDMVQDWLDEDVETVRQLIQQAVPADWQIRFTEGRFIKNLTYQKLPMVEDLRRATEALSQHKVIAALAGDVGATRELQQTSVSCSRSAPNTMPSRDEFLILDADASQQWAINTALAGQNLVIEGPPGTGKSQTIANLIGSFLARGKSVLFVAEKRAAIEAVKKRIVAVGLGEIFLDLHDTKSISTRPAEPFAQALDGLADVRSVEHLEPLYQSLDTSRQRLLDHSSAVHCARQPWGCSYHDVASLLLETRNGRSEQLLFTPSELLAIDRAALERIATTVVELGALPAAEALNPNWVMAPALRQGHLADSGVVSNLLDRSDELINDWSSLDAWLAELSPHLNHGVTPSLEVVTQILLQLEELYGRLAKQLDVAALMLLTVGERTTLQLQLSKGTNQSLLSRLIDRPRRRAIKQACSVSVNKDPAQVLRALELVSELEKVCRPDPLLFTSSLEDVIGSVHKIRSHYDLLAELGVVPPALNTGLGGLRTWLDATTVNRRLLIQTPTISSSLATIEACGATHQGLIARIAEALVSGRDAHQVALALRHGWARQVEEKLQIADPILRGATRSALDGAVENFRDNDRKSISHTPFRIRRLVAERAHQWRLQPEGEKQVRLIRGEALKRRRKGRLSARKLFEAAPELLTALKPCWAMSPLVVSQILPADRQYFDVVIFDEASQIVPYEAVTAILRGHQVVVAGDSKQLAPTGTSFFAGGDDVEESEPVQVADDAEYVVDAVKEAESLLGAMKSCLPPLNGIRHLQWHYRSEDERLISFSNAHPDLYNRILITLPGAGGQEPFRYHLVEGTQFDRTGASPTAEVNRTVELILDHLQHRSEQSLAVVAFGLKHAQRIQKAFNVAAEKLSGELRLHPLDRPDEPFRIRNLETIQGDERDVVIIATGYGLNKSGQPSYAFGPLNHDEDLQGLRRLNVAISRARSRVEIVTTINPDLYDANRLTKIGSKAFIDYLRFARSGGSDLGDLKLERPPMNPFEQDIFATLTAEGLKLVPQYGVSGYRLDFAVQHPEQPGRYVLAIEADGAAYHSSDSARDRDRIRQEHLERMGWRFHRIWSTEWIHNRRAEIRAACLAYETALELASSSSDPTKPAVTDEQSVGLNKTSPPPTRAARPAIPLKRNINEYSDVDLEALVLWVQSDSILRSNDEIIKALLPELGFQRLGSRIQDRLSGLLQELRERGLLL